MLKHYTESELQEELSKLTIICDRREQVWEHIEAFFKAKKIPYISRKLDVGDYACQIEDRTFEVDFAVERKANLDEIAGNFTADRERFEREFLRAKANGTKVYLIVENASWDDIFNHNYRSKLSPKAFAAALLSWQSRFNITILFSHPTNTPALIYGLCYYSAREVLLHGKQ